MNKLLVVGWDGATWEYINPLLAQNRLPHLASLLERGTRSILRSTIPPYTNVAWPSLITGLAPEATGIFDAVHLQPGSYRPMPSNLVPYRGTPLWAWANRYGRRAGVLNVPMTYPAANIDGYLLSGFDSPLLKDDIAYPRDILTKWERHFRPYDILSAEIALMNQQNPHHDRGNLGEFVEKWVQITLRQGAYCRWLWENDPVDLMFTVFSGTDSINHRTHDFDCIARVYEAADTALGEMLTAVDDDTIICLVSDHGSLPATHYISLNHILASGGFLTHKPVVAAKFAARLPRPLGKIWSTLPQLVQQGLSWPLLQVDRRLAAAYDNLDWSQTTAFAVSSLGALYLNRIDRFPQGTVSASAYETTRQTLINHLSGLSGPQGKPLFQKIFKGEKLFPNTEDGAVVPDVVVMPANWQHHLITGFPADPLLRPIPAENEYGTHDPDGIFLLAGPKVVAGQTLEPAHLTDVVPTLLAAWNLPIPDNVNGRVRTNAFLHATPPPTFAPAVPTANRGQTASDAGDEITERLRALGYL